MKQSVKSAETRQRILEAALECFRESGFDATTMRDIAKRAGVALGGAYYYFDSKDAIVLAFYSQTQQDLAPKLDEALKAPKLRTRLEQIVRLKLDYFGPSRRLLAALTSHIDPQSSLSPFGEATSAIREHDFGILTRAIQGADVGVKPDLARELPKILWMYQMGIILFWIHDRSPEQRRTHALLDKSLNLVIHLIRVSSLPLMGPMRKAVLQLVSIVLDSEPAPDMA